MKYQNATEALKNNVGDEVRLSSGNAWMYWDESTLEWVVMYRKYGGKKNTAIYRGASETDALEALTK